MENKLKIMVSVESQHPYWQSRAAIDITNPLAFAFEPLKTTDCSMMAPITGEIMKGSIAEEKVISFRTDAAEKIAHAIANQLVNEMTKNDTFNGYKVVMT